MNADPRVLELAKKYDCVFYPDKMMIKQVKFVRECPKSIGVLIQVTFHTLEQGVGKCPISLDELQDSIGVKTKRTLNKYLDFLEKKKLIQIEDTENPNVKTMGLNPKKFGPLFPSYEEALKIVGEK